MASVFISYSHTDEDLRDQLEKHLAALKREGAISAWHDRRIVAGDQFDKVIDVQLESSDVILFLVSSDFLSSDYCYNIEVKRALERHEEGTARVPVILRPCDWKNTPIGKLLAVPKDGKPVMQWADRDEAFLDAVTQIRAALPKKDGKARSPTHIQNAAPIATASAQPRSSNLRLRKTFSDADRDRFLDEAFEFMARFSKTRWTSFLRGTAASKPDSKESIRATSRRSSIEMVVRRRAARYGLAVTGDSSAGLPTLRTKTAATIALTRVCRSKAMISIFTCARSACLCNPSQATKAI
jgi:hypothetical protein